MWSQLRSRKAEMPRLFVILSGEVMDVFDKLVAIYSKIREVNDMLQEREGVSYEQVSSLLQAVGLHVDPLLLRMYEFRNGIDNLSAFLNFLSAEEAVQRYKDFANFKAEFSDFEWSEGVLPILDINGDVQVCVDLASGKLVTVDIECDSNRVIAPHYSAYVDALYEVFAAGHFKYDPASGSIELDDTLWRDVANRYGIIDIGDV